MSADDVPAPPITTNYSPTEIILYGVQLNEFDNYGTVDISDGETDSSNALSIRLQVYKGSTAQPKKDYAIAAISGYAFEGHCYRLDKPRILIFPNVLKSKAEGCGFDIDGYSMWRLKAKTKIAEFGTGVGFLETLLLEANLPGRRPPNTYANDMQLAHRGGRLSKG